MSGAAVAVGLMRGAEVVAEGTGGSMLVAAEGVVETAKTGITVLGGGGGGGGGGAVADATALALAAGFPLAR